MSKDTKIISDLRSFFAKNEDNRAIKCIMGVMKHINIRSSEIGVEKKENCKFTTLQVLNLLMLFPFFVVKNASRYFNSSLSKLFNCDKDMFYRFMNDGNVKWRKLLYAMNLLLIKKISSSTTVHHEKPVCLIIDDTDAPKTGMTTELIGRIWSHVHQKSILGYKCLTMMLSDGVSQLFLDFSLHGEEGKDKQIIKHLQKEKVCKHNKMLRCTYCTMDVKLDGVPVRLFFCKRGRKGNWNGLLTTDLSLSFLEAYRIYARRWATEVAYKDCKTLLNFGKCQSVHFAAQIASFTLTMMQHNILCTVKRFEAYETIGGLFAEVTNDTLELSVTDKIWAIILDFVLEAAERYSIDATELLADFIESNPVAHTLRNMYIYKQAS